MPPGGSAHWPADFSGNSVNWMCPSSVHHTVEGGSAHWLHKFSISRLIDKRFFIPRAGGKADWFTIDAREIIRGFLCT